MNNLRWYRKENGDWDTRYSFPSDRTVNNEDAVQWVNHFCEKHDYKIVVSSTWRKAGLEVCTECLRNAGLRDGVDVIDITPDLSSERGNEIKMWLDNHPECVGYLVFDDDSDMVYPEIFDRLVKCRESAGFTVAEFVLAEQLHRAFVEELI